MDYTICNGFQFSIEHTKGNNNFLAYKLSRIIKAALDLSIRNNKNGDYKASKLF